MLSSLAVERSNSEFHSRAMMTGDFCNIPGVEQAARKKNEGRMKAIGL